MSSRLSKQQTMVPVIAVGLLLVSSGIATAQDTTVAAVDCADAMTTLELRQCLSAANVRADSAMAVALQGAVDRGNASALDSAQALWVQFRDAQCHAEGSAYEGGTLQPVEALACRLNLTRSRTAYLEKLFRLPEGEGAV